MKPQTSSLSNYLNVSMLILSIITSFVIVCGQTDNLTAFLLILLLFLYLIYLLYYGFEMLNNFIHRLYSPNCDKFTAHSLDQLPTNKDTDIQYPHFHGPNDKLNESISVLHNLSSSKNKSQFLIDYANVTKSRVKNLLRNNQSILSDNNRSLLSNSRNKSKSLSNSINVSKSNQGKWLSQLFNSSEHANSILDDSLQKTKIHLKPITNKQQELESLTTIKSQYFQRSMRTLKAVKFFHDIKTTHEKMLAQCEQLYISTLPIAQQVYTDNLNNLAHIVKIIENNYLLNVNCRDIPQLRKHVNCVFLDKDMEMRITKVNQLDNVIVDISLDAMLKELLSRKNMDNLPWKSVHTNQHNRLFVRQFDSNKNTAINGLDTKSLQSLKQLIKQRCKLDEYLVQPNVTEVKTQEIIHRLEILRQYVMCEGSSDDHTLQSIKRQQIGFNAIRVYINELITQPQYRLEFQRKFFFGFLKHSDSYFILIKRVPWNQDYVHYDLQYSGEHNKHSKQIYHCEFTKNRMSVLYLYLYVLQEKYPQIVRENRKLLQLTLSTLKRNYC